MHFYSEVQYYTAVFPFRRVVQDYIPSSFNCDIRVPRLPTRDFSGRVVVRHWLLQVLAHTLRRLNATETSYTTDIGYKYPG